MYKKEFPKDEHKQLAKDLTNGAFFYYQGSTPNMTFLQEAKSYDKNSALISREIGVPYLKRGFPIEFSQFYAHAAELDPQSWQGWRGYLYLYFYRDYEKALADFDATDILTPNFVDYPQSLSVDYMRAICYYFLDKPKKTIAFLNKHIKLEDSTVSRDYVDSKSFVLRGLAYQQIGAFEKAEQDYMEALRIDKDVAAIFYRLAVLYKSQGELKKYTIFLEKAQNSYDNGIVYRRNYMDEFFKLYQRDIDLLKNEK